MQHKTNEEIVTAELIHDPEQASQKLQNHISLIERILSPENLQRLMMAGGGLLVAGLAIWLWSIGVFDNPILVAFVAGGVNLTVIGAGIWMSQTTRYKIAGRGLTLLGSLVLPLNIWLYDSQNLIVLNDGGQLWIPALLCSIIYAAVARVTRDSMFVYTLVGGVVMTGMLFLAGASGNVFWTVLPMSTFFVVLGGIAIHADRWFKQDEGAFSRNEFGLAFYRAGHIVLLGGLGLLLGGHLASATMDFFSFTIGIESPEVLLTRNGQLWTLALLIAAGYNYALSSMTDRCSSLTKAMVGVVGFAAIVQIKNVLHINLTFDFGLILIALILIATNVGKLLFVTPTTASNTRQQVNNSGLVSVLAPLVSMGLVIFGVARYAYGILDDGTMTLGVVQIAQLAVAAIACLTFTGLWVRNESTPKMKNVGLACIASCSAGLMISLLPGLIGLGVVSNAVLICLAALIPVGIAFSSLSIPESVTLNRVTLASNAAAAALIGFWGIALNIGPAPIEFHSVLSMVFMTSVALSFGVCGFANGLRRNVVTAVVSLMTVVVQFFVYANLTGPYTIIMSITTFGLLLLVSRFALRIAIGLKPRANATMPPRLSGHVSAIQLLERLSYSTILIAAAGAVFFATFETLADKGELALLNLLVFQLLGLGLGYMTTNDKGWKQSFFGAAVMVVMASVLVVVTISTLTLFQRVEVGCLAVGALMVIAGYFGWSKEASPEPGQVAVNESVTIGLSVGSLLLVLPMVIGLIFDRMNGGDMIFAWRGLHEIGGLVVGIALLASGILCRVRSTTLGGAVLLSVVVVSNLLLIEFPDQLKNTSMLMMIGGGTFFGASVLLSMYRDRLIRLPAKVREGKGVFAVLKWR